MLLVVPIFVFNYFLLSLYNGHFLINDASEFSVNFYFLLFVVLCFLLLVFFSGIKARLEFHVASETFMQPSIPHFDGHYDHYSMLMENFFS